LHSPLRMGRTEWLLLLALSGLWGASFFFYKVLDYALPVFTVVLGRWGWRRWRSTFCCWRGGTR